MANLKKLGWIALAAALAMGHAFSGNPDLVLSATASGRSAQARPSGPYLGQTPPGATPQVFAPGLVSTAAHEFSCSFTPDGKEFYFTRMDPKGRLNLIYVTKCVDGTWTDPEVVPFVQNRMSFEPRVTPDGSRLYFTWEKPVPGQEGFGMNIWYVERKGEGWGNPVNPGRFLNPDKAMCVSVTLDGTLYTSDISGGPGTEGIAVAKLVNGKYKSLDRLPAPVNVGAQDMYPHVAPDESYLIFASRRQSPRSSSGLFVSFRNADRAWGEPRAIDLGFQAGLPFVSPDGKYLFFTAGERGKSDIYWVEARFLEEGKRTGPHVAGDRPGTPVETPPAGQKATRDEFAVPANGPAGQKPTQEYFRVPDVMTPKTERMVDVGGRKLHTRLYGQGSPTVLFVSGTNDAPQETWDPLIDALAAEATVVTYDRAGIGKSEIGGLPTHAKQSAIDLRRLIKELDPPKPVLFVGHSYGVMVVKLFASLFPDEVDGLVLMDGAPSTIVDAQKKILTGADLERLERMTSGATAPPDPRTEMDYIFESRQQELKMGPLPRVPTLVLIAGANREAGVPPGFSPEAREKMARLGIDLQKEMAAELGGESIVFEDLSHFMHLEKPEPIIRAIQSMIRNLRETAHGLFKPFTDHLPCD
jgi:pimeloyl-ACP methyl ester carboxylesterase/Tol biopolymer transport system component